MRGAVVKLETFHGRDLQEVADEARAAVGDAVMILRTRVVRRRAASRVEMVAARGREVERFRARVEAAPPARAEGRAGRPLTLALVGPTGVGKTTTLAKLAVHPEAFGRWSAGVLTLDTFRAGAVEQLEAYTEAAGLPLEVIYDRREVAAALRRLAHCEVILVDTPGESPATPERSAEWLELLAEVAPDEVHLLVPAAVRPEVAGDALDRFDALGVTHLLPTKLDEVREDAGLLEIAAELALPTRWLTDGQEIPVDLRPAAPRLLAALSGGRRRPTRARLSA